MAYARASGISLCAYRPLGRGGFLNHPRLLEVAKRHGKTPAQAALRRLLQQEGVAAIPKARGAEHLRENSGILDFSPAPDDLSRLAALQNEAGGGFPALLAVR